MKQQIYVVVAAFNEEKVIQSVIAEIRSAGYKNIIVVDDGSFDQTWEKAQKARAIAAKHLINRGKGAAVKTGFALSQKLKADIVITMDGDGQHNPKQISSMVKKISQGYDVVLGSRFFNHRGMPFSRVVSNKFANFITYLLYGVRVSDSQSGFRAYSKYAIAQMDVGEGRYEYDSKIIREIALNNLKFTEVPIDVRYTHYSLNKKHKQSFMNALRMFIRMALS